MDWSSIRSSVRGVIRVIICTLNIFYAIGSYLWWTTVLRPLRWIRADFYYAIEGTLYRWMQENVGYWLWTAGYTVVEVGDDIGECISDESLVIINHQSTADVPVMMSVVSHGTKGTLAHGIEWIMDVMFRLAPFGWAGMVHGDHFIRQGRDTRQSQLEAFQSHLHNVYSALGHKWLLLFPEGGFLYKRLESSQEYARKHGFPILQHTTLPRIGAVETILNELSPLAPTAADNGHKKTNRLKWIIDITIGYPDQQPLDLLGIMSGTRPPCQITVHYRHYRADSVPIDHNALQRWLYDRWAEKDQLLAHFYRTGVFPASSGDSPAPRLLALSDARCFLVNAVLFASAWFAFKCVMFVVSAIVA